MNLAKMLEAQKELDTVILNNARIKEYPEKQIEVALRVELGELAQEWKQFKYWKKTKGEADRDKLIEEWADVMHFTLSLENYLIEKANWNIGRTINTELRHANRLHERNDTLTLMLAAFNMPTPANIIALGLSLGFTYSEMEEAYYKKNKINYDRVANNY